MLSAADILFGPSAALEAWEEHLHPRGPGGRFISLGTEERAARKEARRASRTASKATPHTHESIVAHAHTMSDEDVAKLHAAISEIHQARQSRAAVSTHSGKSVEEQRAASRTPSVPPTKAEKLLAGGTSIPDVSHHTTALGGYRNEVNTGAGSSPLDATRAYLAKVKGAELNTLATHYGVHGKTAAAKRAAIYEHVVGHLADSLAIRGVTKATTAGSANAAPGPASSLSLAHRTPDVFHHVAALEGHRSRLQAGDLQAPHEARRRLAGVKGAELNALAKHYGLGSGMSAAEKRLRILQHTVVVGTRVTVEGTR
jgi:hypothetical protein